MIELLTQILRFAAESPQNALVVIGFVGAFGMFAPKQSAPAPRRETPRKAAPKRRATARKNRTVVKENLTTQKPKNQKKAKGWFEAPPLSQHEQDLWLNYKIKRDFAI